MRGERDGRDAADWRVVLITTGGTIESVGRGPLDLDGYMFTGLRIPPQKLLDDLRTFLPDAEIELAPLPPTPSPDVTSRDWFALRERVLECNDGSNVHVITHGTNTLEETALFLDLTLPVTRPVVLTGAMRPASALGSDGLFNLVAAVRVALDEDSAGRGVLVVMGAAVHAAAHVTKHASDRLEAFASPSNGPVGRIRAEGRVLFHSKPLPRNPVEIPIGVSTLPRVDVVLAHADADAAHIDASVHHGALGLVVAGTGSGFPTARQRKALERASSSGVWVCRAARGSSANADTSPAFPGWLAAGSARPWQARIVLGVCLAAGVSIERCQDLLNEIGS